MGHQNRDVCGYQPAKDAEHRRRHDIHQDDEGFKTTFRRLKRRAGDGCDVCKAILAALVTFVKKPKRRAMVKVGLVDGIHMLEYVPKVCWWDLRDRPYKDYIHSGSEGEYSIDSENCKSPYVTSEEEEEDDDDDNDNDGDEEERSYEKDEDEIEDEKDNHKDEDDEEDEDEDGDEDEDEEEKSDDGDEKEEGHVKDENVWQAEQRVTLELYVDSASTQPPAWGAFRRAHTLRSSFCLDDAHRIREWLEDCRRDHGPECDGEYRLDGGGDSTAALPTRLLDVGVDPGEDVAAADEVRLYETSPGEQAEYLALSHCWGNGSTRPPTTVAENLTSRKEGIPIAELPQTFRDAVRLTRFLGFRYLWIDSLCIIQGDVADWERESARMAEVYCHATLTIAADGAADSDGGLFAPVGRRNNDFSSTEIRLRDINVPQDGSFWVRKSDGDLKYGKADHMDTESEPLSSRGWAFQEWLLSPRIAHFRTGELSWECSAEHRCECQATRGVLVNDWSLRRSEYTPIFKGDIGFPWREMVSKFTKRSLTVKEDRLPAISGPVGLVLLSGVVHSHDHDHDYIAGHWRGQLLPSLLWQGDTRAANRMVERLSGSYAPTWSWGSVSGGVEFFGAGRDLAKVVDIKVTEISAQASRLGLVKSARIELQGPVGIFPDPVLVAEEGTVDVGEYGYIILDVKDPLEIEECDLSELVFFVIREMEYLRSAELYGLALWRDKERDVFRRVGWATLSCKDGGSLATWKTNELKIRQNIYVAII
ncbi:hypothetical protein NEMBOFW57_003606 [Staphylotrichum longicolle]|uniref:Heterokaryon incompatibility domain-containing protein n=1 Tax=Staphylotrichum longicolle TaxID=669026 RepID=A0AAD4HZP2_9PEZI|nr:hypothetical protein NEMBOFW57_003606 [Staphylotrichum longicolle]